MNHNDDLKKLTETKALIIEAFANVQFPDDVDVSSEGMHNIQLLEDAFTINFQLLEQPSLDVVAAKYTSVLEIYSDLYELSPKECLYILPRLLVLFIHLHSVMPDYTAKMIDFLNLSPTPSSRKQKALESLRYDIASYQTGFTSFKKNCFSMLVEHQYSAILKWLFLAKEWEDGSAFYDKESVESAIRYWQSAIKDANTHS